MLQCYILPEYDDIIKGHRIYDENLESLRHSASKIPISLHNLIVSVTVHGVPLLLCLFSFFESDRIDVVRFLGSKTSPFFNNLMQLIIRFGWSRVPCFF